MEALKMIQATTTESNLVIKVKFGDTLRRFNVVKYFNEQLEFDMEGLRIKIIGLFNLATEADLTLSYTDVDGDVVTLIDDDDLLDVMRQRLNPFRINVLVNTNKGVGSSSYKRTSGISSTPMRSPQVQEQLQNVTTSVAEVLSSISEPLHEAISKMTLDAASQPPSPAPHHAEVVESCSSIGQSSMFPGARSQAGAESNGACRCSNSDLSSFSKDTNSAKGDGMPEVVPNATFNLASKCSQKVGIGNGSKRVATPVTPVPASVDLNLESPVEYKSGGTTTVNLVPAASSFLSIDFRKERGKRSNGHVSGMFGNGDRFDYHQRSNSSHQHRYNSNNYHRSYSSHHHRYNSDYYGRINPDHHHQYNSDYYRRFNSGHHHYYNYNDYDHFNSGLHLRNNYDNYSRFQLWSTLPTHLQPPSPHHLHHYNYDDYSRFNSGHHLHNNYDNYRHFQLWSPPPTHLFSDAQLFFHHFRKWVNEFEQATRWLSNI